MLRFFRQIFKPSLVWRFLWGVREEGLSISLSKARIFIGMHLRGGGMSALSRRGSATVSDDQYLHGIWQELARGDGFHVSSPTLLRRERKIALIGDLNLPQCRKYRVKQLADFWKSQGVACEFAHYQDLPRVTRLMSQATHLCEYRLKSDTLTEMWRYEARRLQLPVLYDIDDPLFSVSAYETYGNMAALDPGIKAHFLKEAPKYLSMMNGADILSFSTPELVKHAARYTTRPGFIRRNFADTETLERGHAAMQSRMASDGVFRIAFASGSQGHEVDFARIVPVLEDFIGKSRSRRLMLLGHFNLDHLPDALAERTDVIPFSTYDKYLAVLARADCAVMPLADDIFNRCKSAVRVIDAFAVGVPAIVGNVGDLKQMIKPAENGFIAETSQDWAQALEVLGAARPLQEIWAKPPAARLKQCGPVPRNRISFRPN